MRSDLRPFRANPELVSRISDHLRREEGEIYSDQAIIAAIDSWLDTRYERMIDNVVEAITSPHLTEAQHFREILRSSQVPMAVNTYEVESAEAESPATIFSGSRAFSPAKLGAMIEHIVGSGRDIYKTNLNKLLFYSDLTFYYLHRQGISGATYFNRPYGPVPDTIEKVLDDMVAADRIRRENVRGTGRNLQLIKPGDTEISLESLLSKEELETLDWVIGQYGHLSPTDISDLSHREKAYASTRPGEPIAYEYAKFLVNLPEK